MWYIASTHYNISLIVSYAIYSKHFEWNNLQLRLFMEIFYGSMLHALYAYIAN